jgi:hypothetical protein
VIGEACSTDGETRNAYRGLVGKLKGRDHSERLSIDGKIILE